MRKTIVVTAISGLIATVVGGLILASILESGNPFTRVWSWVWNSVSWAWSMLHSSHLIPGWAILLVSLPALLGLIIMAAFGISVSVSPKDCEVNPHHSYIEDMIDGVMWRWQWINSQIANILCFCPACDAQLIYNYAFGETNLICERCDSDGSLGRDVSRGRVVATVRGSMHYVVSATEREIFRRMRTGER